MYVSYRFENLATQRYYLIFLTKDLFEEWIVIKCWGGINKAGGQSQSIPCPSYEEALSLMEKIALKRVKRGYTRSSSSGKLPVTQFGNQCERIYP